MYTPSKGKKVSTSQWLRSYSNAHKASTLCTQLCSVCYTAIYAQSSMKSISAIHSATRENAENSLLKYTLHISMCESHKAWISTMLNSSHFMRNSMRSVSEIFLLHTEAIRCLPQIVTYSLYMWLWRGHKWVLYKGSNMMHVL